MAAKIQEELAKQLEDAAREESQREIPVIVTITRGADLALLEQRGLKVLHTYENISAVSGTLTAAEVNGLAALDQVERIDYDGRAHAYR